MALKTPLRKLPLVLKQFRSGGIPWLAARLRREWALPTTALGRLVYRARHPQRLLRGGSSTNRQSSDDCLLAFYDLAVAPLTFDFLWFLTTADLERRRAGLASVRVVIVPGLEHGVRGEPADYEVVVNSTARQTRIANILVPACGFLPDFAGLSTPDSRDEATTMVLNAPGRIFPKGYEPSLPSYPGPQTCLEAGRRGERIAILRAPPHHLNRAQSWIAERSCGREVVTITLRQYGYMSVRDSNVAAWASFAKRLDPNRFFPVFIPDTDHALKPVPEPLAAFAFCSEAALDLGFRFGLYEAAYANLGVNNGPMGLCWLNEHTRYITFKILSESVPQTTTAYMRYLGFEIEHSLPFATPWQKWVWEEDTLEVIERDFAALVQAIDSGVAGDPDRGALSA